MKINLDDTIAAISTPIGNGGIGIVRISGDESIDIINKIFVPFKNKNIKDVKSHTIHYGNIVYNNVVIDEVLVMLMKKPNTYTKEDIIEINCHGGIKSTQRVLQSVLKSGARLAENGEFTKRAFLNGRIDLSQAEAVIDIINAKTELSHKSAINRLEGKLSEKVKQFRNDILTMTAHIEASIDYPEHDIEDLTYEKIKNDTNILIDKINKLLETADTGKIINEGIQTAILGKPNVGKSSLLNVLIEEERAIVTDIPGTTRDVLQEYVNINGIALNIVDTAGIRNTDDIIEKIGVEKSKYYAEQSQLIFFVVDASREIDNEDIEILNLIKNKKVIVLINKVDLEVIADYNKIYEFVDKKYVIEISAKNEFGIDKLYSLIKNLFFEGIINIDDNILISSERNKISLFNAIKSLENVIDTIEAKMPEDFISIDLMESYKYLGEIIGDSIEEDIIDKIFSEFCLGK